MTKKLMEKGNTLQDGLLALLLVDNDMLHRVRCYDLKNWFSEPIHHEIMRVITVLIRQGLPANPVTVFRFLPDEMRVDETMRFLAHIAAVASDIEVRSELIELLFTGSDALFTDHHQRATTVDDGWKKGLQLAFDMMVEGAEQNLSTLCESPIERQFLVACAIWNHVFGDICGISTGFYFEPQRPVFMCFPQEKIGGFRVDFLLLGTGDCKGIDIVVECDGYDFHYSDRGQIERDRARDRILQASGFLVFRFPGSQIYRESFLCVYEVVSKALEVRQRRSPDDCADAAGLDRVLRSWFPAEGQSS